MSRTLLPARRGPASAFTLVELMVTVAIIGIMAAVAIPTLVRYIRKAKTTEAIGHVRRIYEGARTYLVDEVQARVKVAPVAPQFPDSVATTPAASCCLSGGKCPPNPAMWSHPSWVALKFAVADPHYYRYTFEAAGTSTEARFTARANGDLNCNGVESTFEMIGAYDGNEVRGSGGMYSANQAE